MYKCAFEWPRACIGREPMGFKKFFPFQSKQTSLNQNRLFIDSPDIRIITGIFNDDHVIPRTRFAQRYMLLGFSTSFCMKNR